MRRKVIAVFILMMTLFMHMAIIFTPTANGLFQIGNYYKAALPEEAVNFDINLVNNEVNRTTFLISHVEENSVLYLPMDESLGSTMYDQSGNGNNGTVYNASWVDGKYGKALSFNGADAHVEVANNSSLMPTYVSVSAWMKPVEISSTAKGIVRKGAGWGVEGYALLYVDGEVRFGIANAGGEDWIAASSSLVDLNVFSHVVGVYDGTKIYIYVNGVLANSKTTSTTIGSNTCDLYIGQIDGVGSSFLYGVIDDVRVYNRALNAEEIGWLYNNSWSESLSKYNVELGPGESTQVTFSVKVPENASAGLVKFLLTAFPLSNPEHVETQTVTVEVLPKYGVEISLDENETKGKPGEILNFQAN